MSSPSPSALAAAQCRTIPSQGPPPEPAHRSDREAAWPDLTSELAAIVEHSNDAIFSRRFDGVVTTWNSAAERIFGYTAAEMIGRSSAVLLPAGKRDEFRKLLARMRQGQVIEQFETERVRKNGQSIYVSLTLSPIRSASGRLAGFSTIARDISEQRQVHEVLARRELELEDLFEAASVGLLLVGPHGQVQRANQAFLAMLERPSQHVVDRPLNKFHPDSSVIDDLLRRLSRRETVHNFTTEFLSARKETRYVIIDADGHWENGRFIRSRWFVRDISRRRHLERELLDTSERERCGFAHELHDGLGQQLGGIAYLINVLRERLAQRGAPETEAAARIFDLVRKAIEDTRRMARGLSPIREGPEGLMEALHDLAAQTSELQNVPCRWRCPKPVLVSDLVLAGHLYRIAQEAVSNAVKHAHPRAITLLLRQTKGCLELVITDDGKGIGLLSPDRKGLGLRIMQYRAGLIHGSLKITPHRPRGTKVSCSVPLSVARQTPNR